MSIALFGSRDEIPAGFYLTDCTVSGGTLEQFLTAALELARGRLCVRLTAGAMDFTLPCPTGQGSPLAPETRSALLRQHPVIFSEALCTNYLTFCSGDRLHAVLFDDVSSLIKKLSLCQRLGIPAALITDRALRLQLQNESAPQGGAPKRI